MFEFLFKYPRTVFSKGSFVLLGSWPVWILVAAALAAAGLLAYLIWGKGGSTKPVGTLGRTANVLGGLRRSSVWVLETLLVCLLLVMLWQPAISVATLKPQQNIVAVLVDDSHSMAISEDGATRSQQAIRTLNGGLLARLRQKFQVRLYRVGRGTAGEDLSRLAKLEDLNSSARATHIGESLKDMVTESSSLPVGAVVLLSDGADNSGGIDFETISEIRRQRIPIHTIGFGHERFAQDIEITDVQVPSRALADSRLSARVSLRQFGYAQKKARITIKESGRMLASQDVTLKADAVRQAENVLFNAGPTGAKTIEIGIDPLPQEQNPNNNKVTRLVNVDAEKPRILYIEGEPRWEFKFIRRAVEDDRSLQLVTLLRTTQNKFYRQGTADSTELEHGFPSKVEELFGFQGLIIGSVESGYFTQTQLDLIRQFADRRGGGVLFLAGRAGLSAGGYAKTPFAELLPVTLPDHPNTFHRDPANVELTAAGRDSLTCRIEENADKNVARWQHLPYLMNYQEAGTPKPGAVVLADALPTSKGRFPLLVTQNYGRGRSAVFATAGSWRWKMLQPVNDTSHRVFWQQLLRWLVTDTPGRVVLSMPQPVLEDDDHVHLRAEIRDKTYLPMNDARVNVRITGPDGVSTQVEMRPEPLTEGNYSLDWKAEKPGSYMAEAVAKRDKEEIGRQLLTFRREDGVAENFRAEQNRELLEKLSSQTGGRYYRPSQAGQLGENISYSEAGITVRETKDLWDMPIVFLLALMLRSSEWLLRRKWGVV